MRQRPVRKGSTTAKLYAMSVMLPKPPTCQRCGLWKRCLLTWLETCRYMNFPMATLPASLLCGLLSANSTVFGHRKMYIRNPATCRLEILAHPPSKPQAALNPFHHSTRVQYAWMELQNQSLISNHDHHRLSPFRPGCSRMLDPNAADASCTHSEP